RDRCQVSVVPLNLAPALAGADYRILNAEAPITNEETVFQPTRRWTYHTDPQVAEAFARWGFDAAGLSNNHAMDRGPKGLFETVALLKRAGVQPFGAGRNRSEALAPLIVKTTHGKIGVIALGQTWSQPVMASSFQPGSVALTAKVARQTHQKLVEGGVEHTVAFVHWGKNYSHVSDEQREQADWLIQAGFDLVIGHGSHMEQAIEVKCGVPVVYSLGNFIFGTKGRFSDEFPGYGLVVTSEVGVSGFQALEVTCIETNNDVVAFQPRPCEPEVAAKVIKRVNPAIVVEGSVGRLELY
ncbi:MAG: CapA family protein, partial [Proteobacteria bacterium]|nr:CapA family protein [Pseudomonadota bacterium]